MWSRSRPIREHNSTSLKRTPSASDHEIMPYVVTLKTDGKHVLIGLTGKPMSIAGLFFFLKEETQAHEYRRSFCHFTFICVMCVRTCMREGERERERESERERERERERELHKQINK